MYIGYGIKSLINLEHLLLDFTSNNFGYNEDNMKYIGDMIKNLPNLLSFKLYLSINYLGKNTENIKILGENIKILPKYLKNLTLCLITNSLG